MKISGLNGLIIYPFTNSVSGGLGVDRYWKGMSVLVPLKYKVLG